MTPEQRQNLIDYHDRLVREYNDDEDPQKLEWIAFVEIALLSTEPTQ